MPKTYTQETKFYKILNNNMNHHGFQYKEGLNEDTKPFELERKCSGGLYFSDLDHIAEFFDFGSYIAKVIIPADAMCIQVSESEWKADKIILFDIKPLKQWEMWQDKNFCLHAVKHYAHNLQYVEPEMQTEEMCRAALEQDNSVCVRQHMSCRFDIWFQD